ncbi:uncharacterized protein G2W53_017791 [Senna tora]|uniref:Uncharacterized protein n=1 Tax=Senna tora TaxID=362788 RepID=A0A834WKT2_9FABA|nr:uncharacterized protein G2W53_017791 [Senna tora]
MATGQISRRRRLVAADLARENAEVLRESEVEEASAAAEEEVFGLEQILPEKMQKYFGRVKEKKRPPPRKRKCLVWSLTLIYPNKFIGRFSLSRSTSQTLSSAAKTLTIEVGCMVTGQISRRRRLVAADLAGENGEVLRESEGEEASAAVEEEVFGLEISRHRRLVAVDFAGENAEVLRESEGEEASVVAEEEVFGLVVSEGNLLLYSV